ncbi:MAG: hypothetical protein VX430_06950 [Pseudomonadota bacterium]|nr:hypothetical protein [Pseudomonadota bacterium]
MTVEPIIVASGGIGGSAAALTLAHQGRAVHLFEQSSEFEKTSAGIQLEPSIYEMFENMGLM